MRVKLDLSSILMVKRNEGERRARNKVLITVKNCNHSFKSFEWLLFLGQKKAVRETILRCAKGSKNESDRNDLFSYIATGRLVDNALSLTSFSQFPHPDSFTKS